MILFSNSFSTFFDQRDSYFRVMVSINLSIGYQNVEGIHNSLFGCKLDTEINFSCDIEVISESWGACENCKNVKVEGYEHVTSINREKKGKRGRSSGGI